MSHSMKYVTIQPPKLNWCVVIDNLEYKTREWLDTAGELERSAAIKADADLSWLGTLEFSVAGMEKEDLEEWVNAAIHHRAIVSVYFEQEGDARPFAEAVKGSLYPNIQDGEG